MTAGAVYAVVWTLVFVESGLLFGFFLPGDTVLFTAGLVSAAPDSRVSLPLLVSGTVVAAVAGDAVGYWCGRRLGRPWVAEEGRARRAAPGEGRTVLRPVRLVRGRAVPVHPVGAHVHAHRRRDGADVLHPLRVGQPHRRAGL